MTLLPINSGGGGGSGQGDSIAFDGRGIWQPQTQYYKGNTLAVNGQIRMVREDHISGNTVDGSLYMPIESQKGWATKVDRVIQEVVDLSTFNYEAGYSYVFLIEPYPTPLPAGCYVGEQLYCDGGSFIHLRDYADMPETFICDGVVWYKYKWSWFHDTEWESHTPPITAYSGTNPTPTGITVSMKWRVVKGMMEAIYYRTGNASAGPGVGVYLFGMPDGYRIDNTIATIDTNALTVALGTNVRSQSHPIGVGMVNDTGKSAPLTVHAASENKFYFQIAEQPTGNTRLSSSSWFAINQPLVTVSATMQIPIKRKWEL